MTDEINICAQQAHSLITEGAARIEPKTPARAYSQIMATLRGLGRPPGTDRRIRDWAIRIRLYSDNIDVDAVADTQPDDPPDAGGDWVVHGLGAACAALQNVVYGYHAGTPPAGLDNERLQRAIKGLRPTISRRGGNATLRLEYAAGGTVWTVRMDVDRV